MNRFRKIKISVILLLLCLCINGLGAENDQILWQIGKEDNNTAEFALGQDRSNLYSGKFPHDVLFVAGQSDPKQDWPYIQPGPADVWAGSKSHTFTVMFGLKTVSSTGKCKLILDFVDTHSALPPKMQIKINEESFIRNLPRGAGDASAHGQPDKGREHLLLIEFPSSVLKKGTNEIQIKTLEGSWIIYDHVVLRTPIDFQTGPIKNVTRLLDVYSQPFLIKHKEGKLYQPVLASVMHIGDPVQATVTINRSEPLEQTLQPGFKVIEGFTPAVSGPTTVEVEIKVAGESIGNQITTIKPVRKWEVYLLHHSHVDIGYTHVQTEVERKHWEYFKQVIDLAKESANYPIGARFKWNVEVLWAVDSYLKQATEDEQQAFVEAVKKGWIGLDALYGNELTALCRPEELIRLVGYALKLRKLYDLKINSAMITDVPGYTWGIVPVLAQSGVKYFSVGPNRGHRIGYTLSTWGDKPFYWESPCGKQNILCWVAGEGYSFFHSGRLDASKLFGYLERLGDSEYPYDMIQLRYSIGGDNGPPDPKLSDYVKEWNEKYAYPKIVVTTTSEMFDEFERRYSNTIPKKRGDFTPYWEDGAGSSARETSINRQTAERLVQTETLWAMLNPTDYPKDKFYDAWRDVILYDEHTWGSWNSISEPDGDFTKSQWKIKQAFALDAEDKSLKLLNDSLARHKKEIKTVTAIDVFNTSSWLRTDLVVLPKDMIVAGELIKGPDGRVVKSQWLSTGQLAFLAQNIAPFSAKRFTLQAGVIRKSGNAKVQGNELSNRQITLRVDDKTGAISSLKWKEKNIELVNRKKGLGLNDYFYVAGRNPKDPMRNGPVKIRAKEQGPLVASLLIESDAPGCHKLTRELRVIDSINRLDIINVIDKEKIYKQEGVHLGFSFNIPDSVMRMDCPWAVVRPEADQLQGACKNYFTVQRWVDISNGDYGVTWATVDAPLIEVGNITTDPRAKSVGWIKHIEPSTTFYSYVMNNYWETNYKAGQEGPTTFRYSIKPHRKFDLSKAAKFGVECSQPFIVVPVDNKIPVPQTIVTIKSVGVIATALKPSEDGKARIIRLFNPNGKSDSIRLTWAKPAPKTVWLSNLAEEKVSKTTGTINMAAYEIVTLRIPLTND